MDLGSLTAFIAVNDKRYGPILNTAGKMNGYLKSAGAPMKR